MSADLPEHSAPFPPAGVKPSMVALRPIASSSATASAVGRGNDGILRGVDHLGLLRPEDPLPGRATHHGVGELGRQSPMRLGSLLC